MNLRRPEMRQPPPGTFMTQWVIFDRPADYPDDFVLRAFFIGKDGGIYADNVAWTAKTIDELRRLVPAGLYRMPRFSEDDKAIAEVWL
jgi:hypothetical protein